MNSEFFYFPETPLRSPYWNLAIEESIALHLSSHGLLGGVRIWRNPTALVVGLSEKPEITIKDTVLQAFGEKSSALFAQKKPISSVVYVARRASGGGTVYHHPEFNVNFSLYLNLEKRKELFGVKESYESLLGVVIRALEMQGIFSHSKGKSDIAIVTLDSWKKISGNAQFRKKNCIVQHGTLILDQRLIQEVTNLMPHPPEEPDYRKERSHSDFLTALPKSFSVEKFGKDLFRECLRIFAPDHKKETEEEFSKFSFFSTGFSSFRKRVFQESETLRKSKYQSLSYIYRREGSP